MSQQYPDNHEITRETPERASITSTFLGEAELDIPHLIGIRGKAGAGKDTAADYLVERYGYRKMSFATPLKKIVCILTGWDFDFVNGSTPEFRQLRETKIHPVYGMTCRQLLQFIGTELFRNRLHSEIWIHCLRQELETLFQKEPHARVIITDCRFLNEATALIEIGGMIIHLQRPHVQSCLQGKTATHASEKDFEVPGECVIQNDGTLEDLYQKVEMVFKDVKNPI